MMNYFFKKSVLHSFLGLSPNTANNYPMDSPPSKYGLLGLIANETPMVNPNVIASSPVLIKPTAALPTPRLPLPLPLSPSKKKDPGGIGFIDDIGGGVDGLMSCTESLGFESCDERRVDDYDEYDHHDDEGENDYQKMAMGICEGKREMMLKSRDAWRRKRSEERRERINKKFPPPLSSLNQNGQPCFYLKPVRKNGRLELTEVRIQRPEILRAVRQNGRLTLHFVSSDDGFSEINEQNEDDDEEEQEQELYLEDDEEDQEVKLHEEQEDEEEKKVEELWKYRVNGEGFRRCHELVMSHHHHLTNINDHRSLHVWRQPCVTTR